MYVSGESGDRGFNNVQEHVQVLYMDVSTCFVLLICIQTKINVLLLVFALEIALPVLGNVVANLIFF